MDDYKGMYYDSFNAMSKAIELLQKAQVETEEKYISQESIYEDKVNSLNIRFSNPLLFDRLQRLSIEYSTPHERLIIIAVEKMLDDVDLVRKLRQ